MLALVLAAWNGLCHRRRGGAFNPDALPWRRRSALIEPPRPWPRPLEPTHTPPMPAVRPPHDPMRVLQLRMLRRLEGTGGEWVGVQQLGIDGAVPLLLDAAEQLAHHGFIDVLVTTHTLSRDTALKALRLLPKGARFMTAYAVPGVLPVQACREAAP